MFSQLSRLARPLFSRTQRRARTIRWVGMAERLESRQLLNADVAPDAPASVPLKDTAYPIPPSGVYYIAPNGNPGAPGTSPGAPTTLDHALQLAPSGGTIVFRGGVY